MGNAIQEMHVSLSVFSITAGPHLARDDVPLLWRGHNHLGLCQLLLAELHVTRQLTHEQSCVCGRPAIKLSLSAFRLSTAVHITHQLMHEQAYVCGRPV